MCILNLSITHIKENTSPKDFPKPIWAYLRKFTWSWSTFLFLPFQYSNHTQAPLQIRLCSKVEFSVLLQRLCRYQEDSRQADWMRCLQSLACTKDFQESFLSAPWETAWEYYWNQVQWPHILSTSRYYR